MKVLSPFSTTLWLLKLVKLLELKIVKSLELMISSAQCLILFFFSWDFSCSLSLLVRWKESDESECTTRFWNDVQHVTNSSTKWFFKLLFICILSTKSRYNFANIVILKKFVRKILWMIPFNSIKRCILLQYKIVFYQNARMPFL